MPTNKQIIQAHTKPFAGGDVAKGVWRLEDDKIEFD